VWGGGMMSRVDFKTYSKLQVSGNDDLYDDLMLG